LKYHKIAKDALPRSTHPNATRDSYLLNSDRPPGSSEMHASRPTQSSGRYAVNARIFVIRSAQDNADRNLAHPQEESSSFFMTLNGLGDDCHNENPSGGL
jgi:hypothetical protein